MNDFESSCPSAGTGVATPRRRSMVVYSDTEGESSAANSHAPPSLSPHHGVDGGTSETPEQPLQAAVRSPIAHNASEEICEERRVKSALPRRALPKRVWVHVGR